MVASWFDLLTEIGKPLSISGESKLSFVGGAACKNAIEKANKGIKITLGKRPNDIL
jgi:hypothetical protein